MGAGEVESRSLMDAASPQPRSRFLKQKSSSCHADLVAGQAEPRPAVRPSPGPASQGRTGTILRKLAQIERKMQRHKATLGTRGPAAHQMLMDEELSWSQSSQDSEQRAGGPRYLKTNAKPKETPVPSPDPSNPAGLGSENKNPRHLLDFPGKYMGQKSRPPKKPFLNSQLNVPTKAAPPRSPSSRLSPLGGSSLHHRSPSPPSRYTPLLSRMPSRSSINDSQSGSTSKANGRSRTEGSVIKSLDELFSGTADHQGTSSSSSDFHVNVLSLDDLAPSMASQKEGLTEEATVLEISGSLSKELKPELLSADTQSVIQPLRATVGKAAALEEDPGETEISEEISGSSAEYSTCEQENPTSAEYSEDFDLLSEEDTGRQSFSEASRGCSDARLQSGLSGPSSLCLSRARTKSSQSPRKITVKEVAVQTNSSSLMPHWLTAAPVDWTVEGLPTAGHVVSMDAVEELTTYSPAVSALNDLLKQNLLLLRQFIEASRHLHLSFVALLEEEEFHYHTLEEAKMYIERHKVCPPSLEQALRGEKQQVAA